MSYGRGITHDLTYNDQRRYNDQRYDGVSLGMHIPSLRRSVHHTRESARHPASPPSFLHPNGIPPPVSFRFATESHHISAISVNRGQDGDEINPMIPIYNESSDSPLHFPRQFLDSNAEPDYPISHFRLFKLTEEAVGRILFHLSSTDLAALALVDKDCCQLVRTRLFRSVWINFSNTSMALLAALVNEGRERFQTQKFGHYRWRLGACIRRITIGPHGATNKVWDAVIRRSIAARISDMEAVELHARHMNALELVLEAAVPNLEFLDWRDKIPFTPFMASAVVSARLTRLELHCLVLREDFTLDVAGLEEKWQLRSLLLRVTGPSLSRADKFTSSILRLSAPTLENLVWQGSGKYTIGTSRVLFPKLRKLQLRWIGADDTLWSSLVPANEESVLKHLSIHDCDADLGSFLARRGHIETLSHLSWTYSRVNNLDCISFLSANPQLKSCRYVEPANLNLYVNPRTDSPREAHHSVLPMFSSSTFHMLTSLSLEWATETIPPAALRAISTITALKHLCLSAGGAFGARAGGAFGAREGWHVEHKALRKTLRPLKQLKWLVLTRDAYALGIQPLWDFEEPQEGMEVRHRDDMMRYARLLALVLPALEWAHLGQIPMAVERGVGKELVVVPLQERADLTTFLSEMWGDRMAKWRFPPQS